MEAMKDRIDNLRTTTIAEGEPVSGNDLLLSRLDELVDRVGPQSNVDDIRMLKDEVSNFGALLENASQSFANPQQPAMESSAIANLETHLSQIGEHLKRSDTGTDFSSIHQKLSGIEEQIASSRDIAIEMANRAASDAVERAVQSLQENPMSHINPSPDLTVPVSYTHLTLPTTPYV